MDDLELLRRLGSDVPTEDREARARALDRLRRHGVRQEGRSPGSRRGRRWATGIVAAVVVVLVVAGQILLPSWLGGPDVSAAETLRGLAAVAADREPLAPPPGGYVYVRSEQLRRVSGEDLETGLSWTAFVRVTRHDWRAADGSGRILTLFGEPRFQSPGAESAWRRAGQPELVPAPRKLNERFGPGEYPTRDLNDLPTDDRALRLVLEARTFVRGPSGAAETFLIIGLLLAEEEATPRLRASLLRVAGSLPGVQAHGEWRDPLGRKSLAISVTGSGLTTILYFGHKTATLLAAERRSSLSGRVLEWQAYWPPRTVSSLQTPRG